MRQTWTHIWPASAFAALALVWTFPLVFHLRTDLPGWPGDNLAFAWNFWWMRQALATPGASFFFSDRLFAPFGVDLTLHTHTALQALAGATLLAPLPFVAAQNIVILVTLAFNGFAAYLLALSRTRDRGAAVVAGVLYGGAPYVSAHVMGHFGLISTWVFPLFAWCVLKAVDNRSWKWSVAAGACIVATAYTDYYYLIYCAALTLALMSWQITSIEVRVIRRRLRPAVLATFVALLTLDASLIFAISISGPLAFRFGAFVVNAKGISNPLSFAWVLAALFVAIKYRLLITCRLVRPAKSMVRALAPMGGVVAVGLIPLSWRAAALWERGAYVAPHASWRSAPAGIDVATLISGNPFHPVWGPALVRWYERLGIDRVEGVGWLGFVPVLFIAIAVVGFRHVAEVRRWLVVGGLFFVWALGPWLTIARFNTGLMLPANFIQWVPVVSNARMPGRAIVLVYLATAIIVATVISKLDGRMRSRVATISLLLILFDYWPAPIPLTHLEAPPIYWRLAQGEPNGVVCDLPVGVRDGFGQIGAFDDRALFYQTIHGRPIVGGFASRVQRHIFEGYRAMPIVRSLFRLSQGEAMDPADAALSPAAARAALERAGIVYFVLNRTTASPALANYLESLPITSIAREGERELFVVDRSVRNRGVNQP